MIRFNSSVHSALQTSVIGSQTRSDPRSLLYTEKKRAVKWPEAAAGQRLAAAGNSLWSGGVCWGLSGCGVWFAETFSTTNSKKQQSSRQSSTGIFLQGRDRDRYRDGSFQHEVHNNAGKEAVTVRHLFISSKKGFG